MKRLKGVIACLVAMMLIGTTSIYANEGDTTPPDMSLVKAVASTEVEIEFNEKVTQESAENVSNYTLQEAYGTNTEIAVLAAVLDETRTKVTLTTEQHEQVLYKAYVKNVKDDSGNACDTNGFYVGIKYVNSEPMNGDLVESVSGGVDTVNITFKNVMDQESAQYIYNYEIEEAYGEKNKIQLYGATLDESGTQVTLHTDQQLPATLYKVYVKNVKTNAGVNIYDNYHFVGGPDGSLDTTPPVIKSVIAISPGQVEVTFNEDVNLDTAQDITNYKIATKYGTIIELDITNAELDVTKKKVILTVSGMKPATLYGVTAEGVTDAAGNPSLDTCVFVGR